MKNSNIMIAGSTGLVGNAIYNKLIGEGFTKVLATSRSVLDFTSQEGVEKYFAANRPEFVIVAAGRVGGIKANKQQPAQFLYENLIMWTNIINCSFKFDVKKLIFLGSATIYSTNSELPLREESLLEGKIDSNVEPYALAKIAAIKLCEYYYKSYFCNFYTLTLANLYGAGDHYDDKNSHVIPSLIRKFHEGKVNNQKEVVVWGSGKQTRDFLSVDEVVEAIHHCLVKVNAGDIYESGISHVNIGSGREISIKELAELIASIVGYEGKVIFNVNEPDGASRKILRIERIQQLGWKPKSDLRNGLTKAYNYYVNQMRKEK